MRGHDSGVLVWTWRGRNECLWPRNQIKAFGTGNPVLSAQPRRRKPHSAQTDTSCCKTAQNTPDVTYDAGLETTAQNYANKCMFQHSVSSG